MRVTASIAFAILAGFITSMLGTGVVACVVAFLFVAVMVVVFVPWITEGDFIWNLPRRG